MVLHLDSLTQQLFDLISKRIIHKEYLPGEQIPTQQIADEAGISVMPVRLALQALSENGVVTKRPRVGFFVPDFSIEELLNISATRRMFEAYCLENYFDQLDIKGFRRIHDLLIHNTGSVFDDAIYDKTDGELHTLIISSSNNLFLKKLYGRVELLTAVCMYYDNSDNQKLHMASQDEHIKIITAILNGDKAGSVVALHKHLDRVDDVIRSGSKTL